MATGRAGKTLHRMRRDTAFYWSVAPFLLIFLVFSVFPVLFSLYLGFNRWDGFTDPQWVGLENYGRALRDPVFQKAIGNTIYLWFWSSVVTIGLALGISVLINDYVAFGKSYFRMVFLLPLLVAPAIAAIVLRVFFSANGGIVNLLSGAMTGTPSYFDWLGSEAFIKPLVVLLVVWRWTGWYIIIFMAALQSIPRDIYEAARMDGVGRWAIFSRITLPLLLPSVAFAAITATLGGLQMFDEPYVLTQGLGGTNNSATTLGMYLFATAFTRLNFGVGSAVSWYIFAAVVILTLLYQAGLKRLRGASA
ncbi:MULTISPECIES: sugar ABC transporter permease [Devosia]|uniref:Lactose transport system permease protein LacF n=1 Tax=Devosia equisanguinis TaxID=2490941 RepID=A0A447I7Q1_9HYPH|nr:MULTISPECIES: sugar ABC transporter permease [Devosia]VDS03517.1 Lactose transport system permease protein LacF [Devosia equisanguinis]